MRQDLDLFSFSIDDVDGPDGNLRPRRWCAWASGDPSNRPHVIIRLTQRQVVIVSYLCAGQAPLRQPFYRLACEATRYGRNP